MDHQSLKFLIELKVGILMQQNWISKLLGYDIRVEWKKNVDNQMADALLRMDEGTKQELELSISTTTKRWKKVK